MARKTRKRGTPKPAAPPHEAGSSNTAQTRADGRPDGAPVVLTLRVPAWFKSELTEAALAEQKSPAAIVRELLDCPLEK